MSKEKWRELTTGIEYVRAIIEPFILKDVDILPLAGDRYQTDKVNNGRNITAFC